MVLNPCCCGCSLELATKILAVIKMVAAIIMLVPTSLAVMAIGELITSVDSAGAPTAPRGNTGVLTIGVLMLAIYTAELILSILLYLGANQRSLSMCRNWLIIASVLCIISIISVALFIYSLLDLFGPSNAKQIGVASIMWMAIINILYNLFVICVVYAFIEELRGNPFPTVPNPIQVTTFSNV